MRLAFAVAAHLEPEILLVDEVLAVGDLGFQKKCLGKMDDVAKEGRTVLFISHNMRAVSNLCPRTVLLADGGITIDGQTGNVIAAYLDRAAEHLHSLSSDLEVPEDRSKPAQITRVRILDRSGTPSLRYDPVSYTHLRAHET